MSQGNWVLAGLILSATVVRADVQPPLGQGPGALTTTAPASTAATNTAATATSSPRVATPYWNNDDAGSTGQTDLPAADIRAVAPAMARATQTKWAFYQTQDDLSYALRVNQLQFERRPDVVAAMNDQRLAYDALQKERTRVLEPLNENAAYSATAHLSNNISQQIADERDQDKPNPVRLTGMAAVRLNYVQDNRKLESSILDRDDAYQKARQRYVEASEKVRDLRQTEALAVMTDAGLTNLRQQVAVSRIEKLTAASYLVGVIYGRDLALDYAGYYRRTGYLNNYYGGTYPGYGFENGYRY